jgi:Mg2+ and Co2+ transporter CorA
MWQVFNLVTQQDATTSTTIAREAKADGTAMKTIAALTTLFLPGTFLSSVFSMSMLDGAKWWLYVVLALPLTLLVVGSWWAWHKKGWELILRSRRGKKEDVTQV